MVIYFTKDLRVDWLMEWLVDYLCLTPFQHRFSCIAGVIATVHAFLKFLSPVYCTVLFSNQWVFSNIIKQGSVARVECIVCLWVWQEKWMNFGQVDRLKSSMRKMQSELGIILFTWCFLPAFFPIPIIFFNLSRNKFQLSNNTYFVVCKRFEFRSV